MKQLRLLLLLPFILSYCKARTEKSKTLGNPDNIIEQAKKMADALIQRNYVSFVDFQPPKLIEMFGGKEKAKEKIKRSWEQQEADSIIVTKITFGTPSSVINYKDELQCTIPQRFEYKTPKGMVILKSTVIALSLDQGEKWYFIDAANKTLSKIKQSFPDLSDDIVIPEQEKPEILKQ
jgi:hypothetical protein